METIIILRNKKDIECLRWIIEQRVKNENEKTDFTLKLPKQNLWLLVKNLLQSGLPEIKNSK